MTDSKIYDEVLIKHSRFPSHKKILSNAQYILEGINPGCGDEIKLYISFENGVISEAAFDGSICALSQTCADLMLDSIIGKNKEEVTELIESAYRASEGDEAGIFPGAEIIRSFSESKARSKCTLLGWKTLDKIIKEV